jgi:hypothetical protein
MNVGGFVRFKHPADLVEWAREQGWQSAADFEAATGHKISDLIRRRRSCRAYRDALGHLHLDRLAMAKYAKYDPLAQHLMCEKLDEVILTFKEIEEIVRETLPASARTAGWWRTPKTQSSRLFRRQAWRSAGYDASWMPPSKVRFKRVRSSRSDVQVGA